jgi:CDP-diacylglycerol--serine O-phosphatidyltransferase
VLPIFIVVILFIALLIAYPWPVLTLGTLAYLATLPFGVRSYREYERRTPAARTATAAPANVAADATTPPPPDVAPPEEPESERPARLN